MKLTGILYSTLIGLLIMTMSSKCQETTASQSDETESVTTKDTYLEVTSHSLLITIDTATTSTSSLNLVILSKSN